MIILAVLAVFLLFISALGQVWWWRGPEWRSSAAFAWGIFLLSVYLTWPVLKAGF
jgi:hypothetical protein